MEYIRYLVVTNKKGIPKNKVVAHLWSGWDTLCRMYSTGGIKKTNTILLEEIDKPDRGICQMCRRRSDEPV